MMFTIYLTLASILHLRNMPAQARVRRDTLPRMFHVKHFLDKPSTNAKAFRPSVFLTPCSPCSPLDQASIQLPAITQCANSEPVGRFHFKHALAVAEHALGCHYFGLT